MASTCAPPPPPPLPLQMLLLLLAALAPCAPAASDVVVPALVSTTKGEVNHAYWLRRLYGAEVTAREAACARNQSVLHARTGVCAPLFEQGPCSAREWLALDGPGLRGACRPRPCAPGYGFLADEGRCAREQDLCAANTARVFRYAPNGRGGCRCPGSKFRLEGPDGNCHLALAQGPCRPGQVLAPSYSRALGAWRGACAPSPCPEGQVRVETEDGTREALCSALGDLDCSVLMVPLLGPQADVHVALCDDPIRFAIKVPTRPSVCIRDNQGRCVRSLVRSLQPYDWSVEGEEEKDQGGGGEKIVFPKSAAGSVSLSRYLPPCALLLFRSVVLR